MTIDSDRTMGKVSGRVVGGIEHLIVTGELLPGQPIRQELMAQRFGVSRLPVREALRQLAASGLVSHEPNVGYTVARLNKTDFDQIYLMRSLLEREVLLSLPKPDDITLAEVVRLGTDVSDSAAHDDIVTMRLRNQNFHFAMFGQSPLTLIVAELRRLWTMAMPYHAAYLHDPAARARVLAEHDQIVDAYATNDTTRMVELMNLHREGGEASTGLMLQGGSQ
ncbi:GntR family transcriptional regulator [Gordonia sp. NPDC003585]|uniref:GntR family transcriptional regulator n=1 Tax=Gordonia sp. NPDC003585 TaxID=3154275 RepID=UPI0033B5BFF6